MARKRLNTKFLFWAFATVVCLAVVAILLAKFATHENPKPFIDAGDKYAREGEYALAAQNYRKASALDPKNVKLLVMLGKALYSVPGDSGALRDAFNAWQRAVELDPSNKDAWQDLLIARQSDVSFWERQPKNQGNRASLSQSFSDAVSTALQVTRLDPADLHSLAALNELKIRMWLLDIPLPQTTEERDLPPDKRPTDDQKVTDALTQLNTLEEKDPENADVPYWIARARIHQGELALQSSKPSDAEPFFNQAASAFEEALSLHPKNLIPIYLNKFDILTRLSGVDTRTAAREQYSNDAHESLRLAQGLADPKNKAQYLTVKLYWARNYALSDPGRAEDVFREVIKQFPDEIGPKIAFANMLRNDPRRRGDALAQLDQIPESPPSSLTGPARQEVENQIVQGQMVRADIKLDQYNSSPTHDKTLLSDADAIITRLSGKLAEDPRLMKLQGRLALLRNHISDAVQIFDAAMLRSGALGLGQDPEMLRLAALAYQLAGDPARASDLLAKAIEDPSIGRDPRVRIALAELYLDAKNPAKAVEQIDWLEGPGGFANTVTVIKLRIRTLDPVKQHAQIKAQYDRLLESTTMQIMEKAAVAGSLGDDDEVVRLFKLELAQNPKDASTAAKLANHYMGKGDNEQARRILATALQASPGSTQLAELSDRLNGASTADLQKKREDAIIQSQPDPFLREVALANLFTGKQPAVELQHLKKAEDANPNSGPIQDRIFLNLLNARQFEQAATYLPKLAETNEDQAHGLLYKHKFDLARHDVKGALEVGRQLTVQFPQFSNSWEALGEALQMNNEPESAAEKYNIALDREPNNFKALQNLIYCCYQLKKYDDAAHYIADARRKFPDNATVQEMEVNHELRFGDPDRVLPVLRAAIKQDPNNVQNYRVLVSALVRVGAAKTTKGDPEGANVDFNEARDALAQAVQRWPDDADFTLQLAKLDIHAADIPAGEAAMKALIERPHWKDTADASSLMAQFYIDAGQPDRAEMPLRDAMAKAKDRVGLRIRLAGALASQGKYDAALKELDPNTQSLDVLRARLEVLSNSGHSDQAQTEARTRAKDAPDNLDLQNLLLFTLFRAGKFSEATQLATALIKDHPQDLAAYLYRGKIALLDRRGDMDSAISDLTFVRDHSAEDQESRMGAVDARVALAGAFGRKGDIEDGISELETALKIQPENKSLRQELVTFYQMASPPRWLDAEQCISEALAMPLYKNDVDLLRDAALMWERRGDGNKAISSIRAAITQAKDKSYLVHDYLDILLMAKNYDLLMKESEALVANPSTCPGWVFELRGRALAHTGDPSGAAGQFSLALDRAGTEKGHESASRFAQDITSDLSLDKAIELIGPRAQSSSSWKLVAIPLYARKGDFASALTLVDSAMSSFAALSPEDQDELLELAGSVYLQATPPQVDKAIAVYKQVLERHPDSFLAMNDLACLLAEMVNPPQLSQALQYSNQAFSAIQKSGKIVPLVYDTQGWILILSGQVDDGINILHQVIDKSNFADAHYHLAEGYLRKHRPDDARRELQQASDLLSKAAPNQLVGDGPLKAKISTALKEADQMNQEKSDVRSGS